MQALHEQEHKNTANTR